MDEVFEEEIIGEPVDIEEPTIGVYVRLDENNNIIEVNSDVFIGSLNGWTKIDGGFGDKYHHAQSNYFGKPLYDDLGNFNYLYINGEVVEVADADKPIKFPYTYEQLVELKIRTRYTVSDELAILRQRDTKPLEFADYNAFCEQCKVEAREELGITI